MPANTLASLNDCIELWQRALEAPTRTLRITCPTPAEAYNMRARLYHARVLDRKAKTRIYAEGHPQHGRSTYDTLFIKLSGPVLTIQEFNTDIRVEEL